MNFNTIEELIKSDASAQGEGEFWHAGPYAYVEDRTNSDLETAGGVRLRYVYGAQYYLIETWKCRASSIPNEKSFHQRFCHRPPLITMSNIGLRKHLRPFG